MKRLFLTLISALALGGGAFAQSENDANERARLTADGANSYTFSFWGRVGRYYFLQYSEDLVTWTYFPDAYGPGVPGSNPDGSPNPNGSPFVHGLQVSGKDRFWLRALYLESYTGDPLSQDPDQDQVKTIDEIEGGTNPFATKADADGDGLPDDWEFRFGLKRDDPADASVDTDSDGMSNLAEYNTGQFRDPTDYYNGVNYPTVQAIGWPDPSPVDEPSAVVPQPFVVEVRDGTGPLNHIRVTFYTRGVGEGQLSLTANGAGAATIQRVETGADGRARVYFKHPSANLLEPTPRMITAKVGSAATSGNGATAVVEAITQFNYVYPPNTLGFHVSYAIDHRINPIAPGDVENAKRVFSVQNHSISSPNYERNTASWCYDLRQAMTCISPWNANTSLSHDPFGPRGAGTAITAQHVITSAHYELQHGTLIRFITADNQVILRTIRGRATHPDYYNTTIPRELSDITIYTLDAPLPAPPLTAYITPCRLLPANYTSYLSYLHVGRPPVMILDQEEKALVTELYRFLEYGGFAGTIAEYVRPGLHHQRLAFFETLIDGDSSNPAFLIINNTLVLLSVARGSNFVTGYSNGTFVTPQISTLNAMIVAADADATEKSYPTNTGFTVQTVDLSGFNSYTPPNPP